MRQVFIRRNPAITDELDFERKLYVIRKRAYNEIRTSTMAGAEYWYVVSLSSRTIVYKGMLLTGQLDQYFPDLKNPAIETALALVHSRFSTNTFPSWDRAHPYRYLAHNGEINTVRGNANWMHAREARFESDAFGDDIENDPADHQPERQRLGDVRQHARAADAGGPLAAARDDDDDPGAVVEPRDHGRPQARVLPVPLVPDGAVGRPRLDRVHRRPADRRRARSQRPAPVALLRDEGRPGHHGLRGRRARPAAAGRRAQGPAAARPHVPGRHRAGPHHRRRGDQAHDRRRAPVPRVARRVPGPSRGPAALRPKCQQPDPDTPAAAAGGVRLHVRGRADAPRADGARRRRGRRLDGQRHAARGAVEQAAPALRLFQAALRAGHQPADRLHPRGDRSPRPRRGSAPRATCSTRSPRTAGASS